MITWKRSNQPGSMRASRRSLLTLGCATLAALLLAPAGGQAAALKIAPETPVATLVSLKSVYAKPVFPSRAIINNLSDQRPLTLALTTMPIIAHTKDDGGRDWLQVLLPGREMHRKSPPPNGWITADGTKVSTTPWHLVISIATRSVYVYKKGSRVKTFKVVVGKPSTPTPRGEFFIEEGLRLPRKHVGYPYALATSARSHVFKEFMGGPGQIAFHGIVNIPGSKMGTATSNGCIRMTTPAIMWMAKHIKPGTPLTVR
jgi:lipoprotein-anchoring transpeptidase ErfK/SrfK